ncbi:MAG: hypothetical protein AABY93_07125 [Bacteroidota bacterium]
MKTIISIILILLLATSIKAQENVKTEIQFENTNTKKQVRVMVGDDVVIKFKRPDITLNTKILSLTDTSLVVTMKQDPFKLIVYLSNIYSITITRQGNLSRFGQVTAGQDSLVYRIETTNGNEYIGFITSQDQEKLLLKTEQLGEITIRKNDIRNIESINVQQIKGGVLWFDNPQASRYFWAPNGYGIKKGEGYYQNIWILFNQVTYAPSDYFSIGVGTIPLFLFSSPTPVWMTAKVSVPIKKDKINLGAGIFSGTVLGEDNSGFGIAFGIMTFGSRDKNASIGLGYGYAGGDWAKKPMITFSSMMRIGPRSYFLTENYYINAGGEQTVLISLGGRRIVKRMGLDFGLFIPFMSELETFIAIPWLGITAPIGRR